MNKLLLFFIQIIIFSSCSNIQVNKNLESYFDSYNINIKKFKVISFVPIEGCSSCIAPTIDYSRKADSSFLIVLSSISEKTIDYFIERNNLYKSIIIRDFQNLATENGFVPITAPKYYFLKNGKVIKSIDLTNIEDKYSIIREVETYLKD